MTGSITGPVLQVQHFPGLGQRYDQRMIAPLAFVVDAEALFSLAAGFNHCAVGFDGGLIEERIGLLLPDHLPGPVDGLHHSKNLHVTKAAAEVAGGGGIRNPLRAQGIEVGFVGASNLKMLKTGPATEQVQGNVEDMIGFVIGSVELEDGCGAVDVLPQLELPDQLQNQAEPATGYGLLFFRQLVFDFTTTNPRLVEACRFINPFVKSPFASGQLLS